MALLLIHPGVAAQSGREATDAIIALQRAVFERPPDQNMPDGALARELGLRYVEGRGVDHDLTLGCALLEMAKGAAMSPRHDQPGIDAAERLLGNHCRNFSKDEGDEVGQLLGCGFIGLTKHTFTLEPGTWLEVSRRGFAIDRPEGRVEDRISHDLICGHRFILVKHVPLELVKHVPLEPQELRARRRHFLEFISWTREQRPDGLQRALTWNVLEVVGQRLDYRAQEVLVREPGSLWPMPPVPGAFGDGAAFTTLDTGVVRWRFASDPPRSGALSAER